MRDDRDSAGQVEGRLSQGEAADLGAYATAAGHLRRILETLGIERKPRDVTPSLHEYIAAKRRTDRVDANVQEAAE